MAIRKAVAAATLVGGAWWLLPTALGEPPFIARLLPFRSQVEANPEADYQLTQDHGPWLIMAASFTGPAASDDARRLVLELRERFGLPAYWHARTFDLVQEGERTYDRFGAPRPIRYRQGDEVQQVAVLVGDFQGVDDPRARRALQRIKYEIFPACLSGPEESKTSLAFSSFRKINKMFLRDGEEKKSKGPLGHAFITTNPMLPKEYFSPDGVDAFVEEINSDLKYSLLLCPGEYTVKVATFNGTSYLVSGKEDAVTQRGESRLQEGGRKAHLLTEALRSKGYQAYEFHDRGSSIVTVGAFATPGRQLPNGGLSVDPAIQQIIDTFKAEPSAAGNQLEWARRLAARKGLEGFAVGLQPKTLRADGSVRSDYHQSAGPRPQWKGMFQEVETIPFDMVPTVIKVPRRSISKDYDRSRGLR